MKHFFTNKDLSRREARWVEILGYFGIFPITLKPGKIHVLGDTLSRAPHVTNTRVVNDIEVLFIQFEDVIGSYEEDQFFGPILRAMKDDWPSDQKKRVKLEKFIPLFQFDVKRVLYNRKLCVPRKFISTIMHIANNSKTDGYFNFSKTMAILDNFLWRHKARDVKG